MTNEARTENIVVEHGKGREGVGSAGRPIPIHSCRNSWTSFSNIMISLRRSLRGAHSSPTLSVWAAMAYCMSTHAAKRVTRVRIRSRKRRRDRDRQNAVALARAGEEGQKPPSRAQREVISAAAGTVEDCVELGRVWFSICRFSTKTSSIGGY